MCRGLEVVRGLAVWGHQGPGCLGGTRCWESRGYQDLRV